MEKSVEYYLSKGYDQKMAEYLSSGRKRIINVVPNDNFTLTLTFDNGEVRLYDVSPILRTGTVFEPFRKLENFRRVYLDETHSVCWDIDPTVDSDVVWNNKVDLCPDGCYVDSVPVKTTRKPIYGNVPVSITEEQIAEMRELYAKIRQIKYSHAYSMLCLADTTKEERGFFAAVGDINNGRSYAEEQAEVEKLVATIAEGKTWNVAKYEATVAAVHKRVGDLQMMELQAWTINELRRQIQQLSAIEKSLTAELRQTAEDNASAEVELLVPIDLTAEERRVAERYASSKGMNLEEAFKEALFEKIEDEYDSAVAEDAYAEYVASGCKATPINELWKELDHDEDQPNAETVAAIEEVEKLKADPNKKSYGSFAEILAEQPNAETIAAMVEAERIAHDPNARRYQDVEEALAALKADEDEVEEKLQEAEQEAELTDQRYSSGEVLQAMRETIQGKLTFKSNLTMEEIERNFEGVDLFSELMAALEEALAYSKGYACGASGGAFAEQILAELIASGLTGNALLEEFRKKQAQVRPAVEAMIAEAHEAALGNGEYYTYDDVFADSFFSERNMEFLRRGKAALDAGEGVEHEIIDSNEPSDKHDYEKAQATLKLMDELEKGRKSGEQEGWLSIEDVMAHFRIREEDLIDPSTGTKLTPSYHGRECLGNGEWPGYECCCDECDFYLECFPEAKMSD